MLKSLLKTLDGLTYHAKLKENIIKATYETPEKYVSKMKTRD
jgi:hypothetical protein